MDNYIDKLGNILISYAFFSKFIMQWLQGIVSCCNPALELGLTNHMLKKKDLRFNLLRRPIKSYFRKNIQID